MQQLLLLPLHAGRPPDDGAVAAKWGTLRATFGQFAALILPLGLVRCVRTSLGSPRRSLECPHVRCAGPS